MVWFFPFLLALALAGCQSATEPPKPAQPAKPPQPVTGRFALYQMYAAARGWTAEITPLRLNSIHLDPVPPEPGKAAAWQVTFIAPQLGKARSYTYSVIEAEGNLHKGVFAGLEEHWSGPRGNISPFLLAAVRTDSDAAYKTALKKGAEYAAKHPKMTVNYLLEKTPRFGNPTWRVIWGESVGTSNFSIFVDASTGEYLQTMH